LASHVIAVIASLHVFINHPMAVGATMHLITLMEWWGKRTATGDGRSCLQTVAVCFHNPTSVGAMTRRGKSGFTPQLVNPYALRQL
jgi:hypothetical protein